MVRAMPARNARGVFIMFLLVLGLRPSKLLAVRLETEVLAEKRHHMVLEAI